MPRSFSLCGLAPLALIVAGCHDRIAGPDSPIDRAVSLAAISVVDQTGMVGAAAASPPTVIVRDGSGRPVAGVRVSFDGAVTATAVTGRDGTAALQWLLPSTPGSYELVASVGKLASVRFRATAVVGPPAYMSITTPVDRAIVPGAVLPESVAVFVMDYVGNALPGVTVTFEAGGPAGGSVEHASAVTNDSGIASPGFWTPGTTAGVYTLTARADGVPYSSTVSARVYEPLKASTIAAGAFATCANDLSGATYCWGEGFALPTRKQADEPLVSLTVGTGFACGLTAAGAAFCWGDDPTDTTFGRGTVISGSPHRVGGELRFRLISAGDGLVCGASTDGRTYCWGGNTYGQLGNGTTVPSVVPAPIVGTHDFVALSAGSDHACGVAASGEAYCWGRNDAGQLGSSSSETCDVVIEDDYYYGEYVSHTPCSSVPLRVSAVPALASVSAGDGTCGLAGDGQAFCWGRSNGVQLVSSTLRFNSISSTQQIASEPPPASTVKPASMCGTTASGTTYCGDAVNLVAVASNVAFSTIVAGRSHQCGIARDSGVAYCWGVNAEAELGNGTLATTSVPTPVVAP